MDSQTAFCPNEVCPAKGQAGTGNIVIHSRQHLRDKCKECGQTFTATKGTPFYRLRYQQELVVSVVTRLAHGCPPQAIVAAFGLDERTIADWSERAAAQCQQMPQHLVQQPHDLGEVQADELRVKSQGAIVWVALAMQTTTRLWLGGVGSERRDRWLITRLMQQVRGGALSLPLLLVTDGFAAYATALCKVFLTLCSAWGAADGAYKLGPGCATRKSSNAMSSGAWSRSSGECSTVTRSKSRTCGTKRTTRAYATQPS